MSKVWVRYVGTEKPEVIGLLLAKQESKKSKKDDALLGIVDGKDFSSTTLYP